MLLFELHSRNAVGRIIGKLSERKLVTSLLASWKTAGKLQNIFEVHSSLISSENPWYFVLQQTAATVLNLVSVCLIFQKTKTYYFEIHFKRQNIHAFVRTISQKTALKNLSARSSLVSAFKPRRLNLKKDAVQAIFYFKIGIGQKRSHGNNHPCPPKSGTTLQGNSKSVRSALPKRRKLL